MPIPPELALTTSELDELMVSCWNMRIATLGPGGRINLTPLWFGLVNGKIYFYGRGQKVVNLRRTPTATILVDRNERFPELQGAMLQGRVTVLEDAAVEHADHDPATAQEQMATKYAGGHDAGERRDYAARSARGRHWHWMVFAPTHVITWDNTKLRQ